MAENRFIPLCNIPDILAYKWPKLYLGNLGKLPGFEIRSKLIFLVPIFCTIGRGMNSLQSSHGLNVKESALTDCIENDLLVRMNPFERHSKSWNPRHGLSQFSQQVWVVGIRIDKKVLWNSLILVILYLWIVWIKITICLTS